MIESLVPNYLSYSTTSAAQRIKKSNFMKVSFRNTIKQFIIILLFVIHSHIMFVCLFLFIYLGYCHSMVTGEEDQKVEKVYVDMLQWLKQRI